MSELTIVLHNIRSVHNVGSIFRTADAAGIKKIYLCGITPTPLDRFGKLRQDFAKVALGAEEYVAWESVKNTGAIIKKFKKDGYKIYALEQAKRSISLFNLPRSLASIPSVLILGDEIRGISSSLLKLADHILEIPMRGKKESLNVSVAFGIAAYALIQN